MATTDSFLASLGSAPHEFLQPSLPLHTDTLAYLKHALDPVASDISRIQQERLQDARKKRKRGQTTSDEDVLRLKQIHTQGFSVEQVWEQAKRVIDAARIEAEEGFRTAQAREEEDDVVHNGDEEVESEIGEDGLDWEYDGHDVDEEVSDTMDEDLDADGEITHEALDGEDFDMDSDGMDDEDREREQPTEEFVTDKFGLNDGFFSIDNFNKQSEFLEQQDARGEDDGAASDEEDIDYDADPQGQGAAGQQTLNDDGEEDENDDDEEGGPTFGDPDAASEDEDDDGQIGGGDMDDMGGMGNTNNVMYADFFAPPAQKKRPNKKGRPNPHNFPKKAAGNATGAAEAEDEEMGQTMAAVHRDLFDDEESGGDEEVDEETLDPADPRSRRSAHERRRAAIAEEIRKLEAANVAKREWTLSGEARAADRPMNSLLEEDLEFERAGKPVPVITAEVSESIEELIKRRILANDFQDLIRRRPDDLATGNEGRRGLFELDDAKSKKGLAEEYEEEHLRRTDPNFVDVKDEKLAKEQKEIEALWRDISSKLDSLSSWHFRPKQPTAQLDIRVDAPTITMEDARPSAGGDVAGASQLAPQEIYKAGDAAKGNNTEVVGKSGLPAGREELTREEKKRRRKREKERAHKAGGNVPEKPESKKSKEKKEMLGDLKKGGVKIIGKKGQMQDVQGRNVKTQDAEGTQGAARFKL